ncbi:PepSY-associated TM helix family protein [Salinisphaera dokdonensis CL-ES53]|uniref:PepSY-associated TM helix family protein n=1 Tax=Salinisphaera dokdonensis CL-ES53 TaxID=1304272 RepID=A0ABV2AZH8_9GAMM
MKGATIKRFTSLHTWTGITTGVLLFVAFYAGALTVYKAEIDAWANPVVHAELEAERTERLFTPQQAVEAFINSPHFTPDFYLFSSRYRTHLPDGGETPGRYAIYWSERVDGERVGWDVFEPGGQPIQSNAATTSQAANFIELLHFTMGLPETFGTYLFGAVTLLYGVALLSGLVIHLPHLVKDLFSMRIGSNLKLFWQDAHNVIGVLSLPFHLMFVVTSLVLALTLVAILGTSFFTLGNQFPTDRIGELYEVAPHPAASDTPADMLDVPTLFARVKEIQPDFTVSSIHWHGYGTATAAAEISGDYPDSLISSADIQLDASTGALQGANLPGAHNPALAASGVVVSLHFARFGEGLGRQLVRLSYLLLGLLGAFLFYSGNLLWIETRRKRRNTQQPHLHHALARLTVAGCLGTVLGISLLLLTAKLLPAESLLRAAWVPNAWYLGLAASAAWVLLRPVWRGTVEVLWACAVITAAVPIANAIIYMPPWQSALIAPGVFGVDLVALLLAIGFALTARAAARRAHNGQPNSVWADTPRLATHEGASL